MFLLIYGVPNGTLIFMDIAYQMVRKSIKLQMECQQCTKCFLSGCCYGIVDCPVIMWISFLFYEQLRAGDL